MLKVLCFLCQLRSSMTCNICYLTVTVQAPGESFSMPLALTFQTKGDCEGWLEGFFGCVGGAGVTERFCFGMQKGFEQRCLGKKKISCQILSLRQHEYNKFLHNSPSFPGSAKCPLSYLSSCSNLEIWKYSRINIISLTVTREGKRTLYNIEQFIF